MQKQKTRDQVNAWPKSLYFKGIEKRRHGSSLSGLITFKKKILRLTTHLLATYRAFLVHFLMTVIWKQWRYGVIPSLEEPTGHPDDPGGCVHVILKWEEIRERLCDYKTGTRIQFWSLEGWLRDRKDKSHILDIVWQKYIYLVVE